MSGKYTRSGKRTFGSKSVFLMLALVLVIGCTIGGTLAWLTDQSEKVTNTFVAGQIGDLTLEENDTASTTYDATNKKYIVIPGMDITKSPKVTYTPTNDTGTVPVDAYVFVNLSQDTTASNKWTYENSKYVIKSDNKVVMSFEIADGWTQLEGQDVFYREVKAPDSTLNAVSIIKDNKITVSDLITEDDVDDVAEAADGLTFQAYAIQKDGFTDTSGNGTTVDEAWTALQKELTASN